MNIAHNIGKYCRQFCWVSRTASLRIATVLLSITHSIADYITLYCRVSHTVLLSVGHSIAEYCTQYCLVPHRVSVSIAQCIAEYHTQYCRV